MTFTARRLDLTDPSNKFPDGLGGSVEPFLPGGQLTQIKGFGHSYMAWPNVALAAESDTYLARLAAALDVTVDNLGVPGGALMAALASNTGGWQYVFNELPRGVGSARDQIVILDYGIDDIVQAGAAPFSAAFSAALASVISRIRTTPGSIKLANDASIVYAGTWTYDSGATFGIPVKYSFTSGDTYTISVPNGWPGGTVCIDLVTAADDGATHTFTIDGDAAGSINTVGNSGGVELTPSVFRIPGVGLGAHTIVGTISALTGSTTRTEVVGWHTETGPLPVVFCLKQPKLITYDTFAALGRPTDTSVDTVNTDIDTVAAAFDANVVSVDRDGAFGKQMALFMYYDGLTTDYAHPGPLGHELITATLLNAIRAYPTNTSDQTSVSGNAIQTQSVESLATSKTFGAIPNHEYVIILKAGAAPTFPTPVGNLARYRIRNTTGGTITLLLAAGTLDTVASPISLLSGVAPLTIVSDGTVYWTV